jgi:hypothetical protein
LVNGYWLLFIVYCLLVIVYWLLNMRHRDMTLRQATSLVCRCCGQELPVSKFRRYPAGTYRHTCNHCYWLHHGQATRLRRILRELEERN